MSAANVAALVDYVYRAFRANRNDFRSEADYRSALARALRGVRPGPSNAPARSLRVARELTHEVSAEVCYPEGTSVRS